MKYLKHYNLNTELDPLQYDALENLAGFICNKINSSTPFTWVDHVSEGGLSKPSEEFMIKVKQLEEMFNKVNGDGLLICKNYMQNLLNEAKNVDCTIKIKTFIF